MIPETANDLKNYVINTCVKFLQEKHSDRFSKKCIRDLNFLYDAILKDLKYDTLFYTTHISDYFWKDGKLLLSDTTAEMETYNLLETIMLDIGIDKNIKKSISNIKNIILNGSELRPETNLATAAKNANYCQRNWDRSFTVPEEDVETLTRIAEYMPSKQNVIYFNLLVSTDKEFNKWLYEVSIFEKDVDTFTRNSQTTAPLVFIYFETDSTEVFEKTNLTNKQTEYFRTIGTTLGLSAGAVALAANNMGYRTGFCQCMLGRKITDRLEKKYNLKYEAAPRLILGIGKPNTEHDWNVVLDENENFLRTVKSIPKKDGRIIHRLT